MAAPTLTLLTYTDIADADTLTGWGAAWGYGVVDTLDPDIKKEGTYSVAGTWRNDLTEDGYEAASAPVTASGKTFRGWINTTNLPYMETESGGGYELVISDGTTYEYKTIFGSDTYFGGWFNIIYDMDAFTTVTLANVDTWGIRINHTSSAKNIDNLWMDAYKYLDGYSMTGGTAIDPITLADIEEADRGTTTLYGYGIVSEFGGVYYCTGDVQFGTGATTMYFEMDGEIFVFEDKPVASGLYSLSGIGSGSNVTIADSVIISAGATDDTRFVFDWSDADLASLSCTRTRIVRASSSTFKSGQTVTGNIFDDCGQIDPSTSTFTGNSISNTNNANGALLLAGSTTNMSDLDFVSGGGIGSPLTEHAIEITSAAVSGSPLTGAYTLTNFTYTGYGANDTTTAAIYNNSGGHVTLTISGGDVPTVRNGAGSSTTVVAGAVTVKATAVTTAGVPIQNARVLLSPVGGSPDILPYKESVTITSSGAVATVTHTGHGIETNDKVAIDGADQEEYNGVKQITVTDANTYTYTLTASPLPTSPATGTITSTFVALSGLTDVNGEISTTRVYDNDLDVSGWTRKSTTPPLYIQGILTGTISTTTGFNGTGVMVSDE